MPRLPLFLLLLSALPLCAFAQNKTPIVTTAPLADQTQFNGTSRTIDLSAAFQDPDQTAAVRMTTVLGTLELALFDRQKPATVANFLKYVNEDRYFANDPNANQLASSFIHRAVPDFIVQGGGFIGTVKEEEPTEARPIQVGALPPIQNEPGISNTRGTIAMAKVEEQRDGNGNPVPGTGPDSATSQWFINLANNGGAPSNLDTQNGGFTVFGRVLGAGMNLVDQIAASPIYNLGSPFDSIPLRNYTLPDAVRVPNFVSLPAIEQIAAVSSPLTFSASSANPAVASVTVSASKVLVAAKQVGSVEITVTATDLDGAAVSDTFSVNIIEGPGRLLNISTRVSVRTEENVLIGGFIIRDGASKRLLVRAIGPSLSQADIDDALQDPVLELRDQSGGLIALNDNWAEAPNKQEIIDTGIAPTAGKESAILATVPSGAGNTNYTAIVRGLNEGIGVGLVEVYDLESAPGSTILNISTRGRVGRNENVMIGGFILGGGETRRVAVRAIGPSLGNAEIEDALEDPALELRNSQGTLVDSNNDWQSHPQSSEMQEIGLAPSDSRESALIDTLSAGNYTAIVRGSGDPSTGVGLVEVYSLP